MRLSLFPICLAFAFLSMPHPLHASKTSSCYAEAIQACKAQFTQQKKTCKEAYSAFNPRCKAERKQANERCAEQKKATLCERQKLTPLQTAACQQKKTAALAVCVKPNEDPQCAQAINTCKQNCMRNCRVCTIEGVRPCVEGCEEQQALCTQKSEDAFIRCQRNASAQERECKNHFTLETYKTYYNCTRDRALQTMRCQNETWNQQSACYHRASDEYRTCARNNTALYQRCTKAAKDNCAPK